jgi:hypothetical protein
VAQQQKNIARQDRMVNQGIKGTYDTFVSLHNSSMLRDLESAPAAG